MKKLVLYYSTGKEKKADTLNELLNIANVKGLPVFAIYNQEGHEPFNFDKSQDQYLVAWYDKPGRSEYAKRAVEIADKRLNDDFELGVAESMVLESFSSQFKRTMILEASKPPASVTLPALKQKMEDVGFYDELGKQDDSFIARRGFFYTKGKNAENFRAIVENALKATGFHYKILGQGQIDKPFRGSAKTKDSSHWWVKFTANKPEEGGQAPSSDAAPVTESVSTLADAKKSFKEDGRVHFHAKDEAEMAVMYELQADLKKAGIEFGETNVTPEQYTVYDTKKWNSDLKKIKESADEGKVFYYSVNLDERGDFQMHVENHNGDEVFSIDDIDDLQNIIDDGFMKHKEDYDGLEEHLKDMGIMQKNDTLEDIAERED